MTLLPIKHEKTIKAFQHSGSCLNHINEVFTSFLSGVLAVNANRKNVVQFLTSNLGVVDRRKIQKLSTHVKVAIKMIDLDLNVMLCFLFM